MTYVGKILVIVIMIFAIGFLFLSTMIFMTERDWKKEVDRLKGEQSKLTGALTEQKGIKTQLENDLIAAEKARAGQVKDLEAQIANLNQETTTRQTEITAQRKEIETSLQSTSSAQQQAEAKDAETSKIREQLRAIQNEANAYKLQQMELKDKIRELELEKEAAERNNKKLRDDNLTYQEIIRSNGLNADPGYYQRRDRPLPVVDGEILKADNQNRRYQISVGKDDGIEPPDELYVYRTKPKPEYLGVLRVQIADSDQAVATLVGSTVQGKKIQEGDIVSTTIRPRN